MNFGYWFDDNGMIRAYITEPRELRCCHYHGETDTFCRNDARPGSHYCAEHKADQR